MQVLLVDMQYATNVNPDRNPFLAEHFLDEIRAAYQHSRGCFLLVSKKIINIELKKNFNFNKHRKTFRNCVEGGN